MIRAKTGPAFPERPKTLTEQLAASLLLVPARSLPTEADLDRVHGELEALLLGAVPWVPMEVDEVIK